MAAAIPALIGGVTSLLGGGIAANAAGNASQQQSQSIDKGLAAVQNATDKTLPMMQQMYQQGQAGLSPYQSMGSGASSRLSSMLGIPASQSSGASLGSMATPSPSVGTQTQQFTIYAPNGETKQTADPQEAQFYAKKGLRVEGGGMGAGGSQVGQQPKAV